VRTATQQQQQHQQQESRRSQQLQECPLHQPSVAREHLQALTTVCPLIHTLTPPPLTFTPDTSTPCHLPPPLTKHTLYSPPHTHTVSLLCRLQCARYG